MMMMDGKPSELNSFSSVQSLIGTSEAIQDCRHRGHEQAPIGVAFLVLAKPNHRF